MTAPACPECKATDYEYEELRRVELGDYMWRIYFEAVCTCGRVEKMSTEAHSMFDIGPASVHESSRNSAAARKLRPAKCYECGHVGKARDESYLCGLCDARYRYEKHARAAEKWQRRVMELKIARQYKGETA